MSAPNTNLTAACRYIQSWLDFYFPQLHTPGLSVAIAHAGKPIFAGAWGVANTLTQEKLTPQHIFRAASHSKTFTATLAFLLKEQGLLRLDDPLGQHLPWLRPNKSLANLTLRQALSHSTGIARDGDQPNFWGYDHPFPTTTEWKEYYRQAKPVITPGTQFKYSNFGYGLVRFVLEAASQEKYEDLLQRLILKPLNLKHTGPDQPHPKTKVAAGHSYPSPNGCVPLDPFLSAEGLMSVTGIHSTPTELAKAFSAFILPGGLLTEDSRREFLHPQWPINDTPTNKRWYCHGVAKDPLGNNYLYGHGGGYPGFISKTLVCPSTHLAISVGFNTLDAQVNILRGIYDLLKFFYHRKPAKRLLPYEGRFYNLWGTTDILATNDKLIVTSPHSISPLDSYTAELTPRQKHAFTITKADGYSSFGQTVEFKMQQGQAVEMLWAGRHNPRLSVYQKQLKTLTYTP